MTSERGQVLILWILAATIILFVLVITFDVGIWLSERRNAQKAADLAALAAATELQNSNAAVIARGEEFAGRNGYDMAESGVNVEVVPQYNNNPDLVEVKVSRDAPIAFLGFFTDAFTGEDIAARAVATKDEGDQLYAIFANRNNCNDPPPLEFSGSDLTVVGAVHSNGDTKVNGSNNEFDGPFTSQCQFDISGSGNDFDPPPDQTGLEPMPINYAFSAFPCDITYTTDVDLTSRPEVWVNNNPATKQLKQLVICSTGDLQLSGQGVSGKVTLAARDEVKISGSQFNLTGNWNNILLYSSATHDSAIDVSGSGGDWVGIIHAPRGKVKIQGGEVSSDSLDLYGSIVADRVIVSGSDFTITARFVGGSDVAVHLVE